MRSPLRSISARALPWLVALVGAGCGVSMRYVVESDMRFEHCYRIDEDARVSVAEKRACWAEWDDTYRKGQDANRIAYASERLRVLDAAASGAPVPSPHDDAVTVAAAVSACPPPNTPYAPPPSMAPSAANGGVKSAIAPAPPIGPCSASCGEKWKTCADGCAGATPCARECDERLRTCASDCL